MKTPFMLITIALMSISSISHASKNWTGDGGKGTSITIDVPQASGLEESQSYLPALVQAEFVSNFSGYSAISVLDWKSLDGIYEKLYSDHFGEGAETARQDLGNLAPTTHFMDGKITKTATGYHLQMNIVKTSDKITAASYSGTFAIAELDSLTGIRRASLELLQKIGVALTEKAREELAGTVAASAVNAQTAFAKGITAQRKGTEVAALSYYFQAAAFDPSMLEAANRSSVLKANISSGNMGDNIRNDIQWRKEWVARLTETERFFDNLNKTERMPYTLHYSKEIEQGKIDYQNETVTMSIETILRGSSVWPVSIERALQAVYDGLNATKKKEDWGLGKWPQQGVTDLNAFAKRSSSFSVVFELVNNKNKVIGRQTLQEEGWWGLNRDGRPSIEMFDVKHKTLSFQSVNANDITDNLAIRIASVNGKDARAASTGGVLQIKVIELDVSSFSDSRDGQKYRKAKIGEQVWMAENLNYKTGNSKCYDNSASNCKKYGRLYDWATAMKACPKGWHLPSSAEWEELSGFIGGGKTDAKHLKAKSGWDNNGNGRDTYGFAAIPGGFFAAGRFGGYNYVGSYGYWWSASEYISYDAYIRGMRYYNVTARWVYDNEYLMFSLRCVKD